MTAFSVHPRMRGERISFRSHHSLISGSSPHARGTQQRQRALSVGQRFIPACAGNANEHANWSSVRSVHPRMRGERLGGSSDWLASVGSSPHARGTHEQGISHHRPPRFIPACAGNACAGPQKRASDAVHPRMRGERHDEDDLPGGRFGSSPHARGTPHGRLTAARRGRFIPACAGNAVGCR